MDSLERTLDEFTTLYLAMFKRNERKEEYPIITPNRWKVIRSREKPFSPEYLDLLAYGNYEVPPEKRKRGRL